MSYQGNRPFDPRTIQAAITALLNARTWDDKCRAIEKHQAVLTSDEALRTLNDMVAHFQAKGNAPLAKAIEQNIPFLFAVRSGGIEALGFIANAYDRFVAPVQDKISAGIETLTAYMAAESWEEARSIVEQQHEHLLTEAAIGTLRRILENETGEYTNDDLIFVAERLRFLEEARSTSIATAWTSLIRRIGPRR